MQLEPCPFCGALPCDWVDNPHTRTTADPVPNTETAAAMRDIQSGNVTRFDNVNDLMADLNAADPVITEAMMTDEELIERLRSLKWLIHDEMRGLLQDSTAHDAANRLEALIAERDAALLASWAYGKVHTDGSRSGGQPISQSDAGVLHDPPPGGLERDRERPPAPASGTDKDAENARWRVDAEIWPGVAAGWLCASCGRSYAPTVSGCRSCNEKIAKEMAP